jgi:hypothetical protein
VKWSPLPHRLLSRCREHESGVSEIGREEEGMVGVLPTLFAGHKPMGREGIEPSTL